MKHAQQGSISHSLEGYRSVEAFYAYPTSSLLSLAASGLQHYIGEGSEVVLASQTPGYSPVELHSPP